METEERKCGNCRYFVKCFYKFRGRLMDLGCGRCINDNRKRKKCKEADFVCGLWEPYEIQVNERRESIKSTLRRIARSLDDIALTLKDEEGG